MWIDECTVITHCLLTEPGAIKVVIHCTSFTSTGLCGAVSSWSVYIFEPLKIGFSILYWKLKKTFFCPQRSRKLPRAMLSAVYWMCFGASRQYRVVKEAQLFWCCVITWICTCDCFAKPRMLQGIITSEQCRMSCVMSQELLTFSQI